jgi:hypothetical protein
VFALSCARWDTAHYTVHRKTKAAVLGGKIHIKPKNYIKGGKTVFSVGQTSAKYNNYNWKRNGIKRGG